MDLSLAVEAVEHAASTESEADALELLATVAGAAPAVTLDGVLSVLRIAGASRVRFHLSPCL